MLFLRHVDGLASFLAPKRGIDAKRGILLTGVVFLLLGTFAAAAPAADDASPTAPSGVELKTLLREVLEGVDDTEVIVSRVTVPPNTALPKHWHPGEEFAYVLEGSATLWQEGKDDIVVETGGVVKVPLRQVHTAISGDDGAVFLVFRVHEQGEPERVLED